MHGIHRADLLNILVKHTSSHCRSHFSKKLVSYKDAADEPVLLYFADGTVATCDLLVGADGVKSAVRAAMYTQMANRLEIAGRPVEEVAKMKKYVHPTWSGAIIYRYLIPREELEKAFPDHVSFDTPIFVSKRLGETAGQADIPLKYISSRQEQGTYSLQL